MDFLTNCRLCLSQKPELFNIFEISDFSEFNLIQIAELIAPETKESDERLSRNICTTCKDACNSFLEFRKVIIESYNYQQNALSNEDIKLRNEDVQESIVIEYIEEEQLIEEDHESIADEHIELEDIFDDNLLSEIEESDENISEEKDNFTCSKCNRIFENELKLQEHLKTHSTAKTRLFPCATCKRKFTSAVLLKRHEIVHSDLVTVMKIETKHRCIICNTIFDDKTTLEDHIREIHKMVMETQKIACLYCNKNFDKLNNLLRHLKSHDENKTHLCNVCNKTFAMSQEFIDHLNRHKGFLPHCCQICSKSYLQASKLKIHLKTHANDKVS